MTTENSSASITVEETTTGLTIEPTTLSTTTTLKKDVDPGMPPAGIAGITIGAIVALCIIVAITIIILIRYRVRRKKGSDKYNKAIKDLNINKLPSPSEVESAEVRPLERMPTGRPEIDSDLGSSTKHYQNIHDSKYENIQNAADTQPIYLEPEPGAEKRLYTTAEGSEYYTMDDHEKPNPNLPSRDDYKKQPTAVSKNKTANNQNKTNPQKTANNVKAQTDDSSSDSSETDSDSECKPTFHSKKDYVNLQDQKITIPENITKGRQPKQSLIVDDVYENEELSRSPRMNTKLS